MQTLGVNVEQPPGKLTSASRPMNIASVRATSLRTSGLRAASSRRGTDAQKETIIGTEATVSFNQLSCLSSMTTHLSYTNSQEPGEDSQLNAFALVEKLVNLNASLMFQKPELSIADEQSCMKGHQSNKGIHSLARTADMKNLQDKIGIYDWIDSQPNENGDFEQVFPTFEGQQEAGMPTEPSKVGQGVVSDRAGAHARSNALVLAEEASSVKQQNTESSLISAGAAEDNRVKEGSTDFEHRGVSFVVSNELPDTDASYDKEEAEMMDIGANTQIALEAMDIMRCAILLNNVTAPHNEKAMSSVFDIGNDTQNAIDAIDIMRHGIKTDISLSKASSLCDISTDTQTAIDAIDIMRQGVETDIVLPKPKATSLLDIGNDTQTAIEAIDIMRQGIETNIGLSKIERREGLRVQNSMGDVKKNASQVQNSNKRFLLDFSSAMVPRRKRSRLCAPRGTLNENVEVFRCQEHDSRFHEPLTKADKQAQPGKPARFELQKSALWPKQDGNSPDVAVFTESTNGESVQQTKKDISTTLDRYASLEQTRKRRKCESRCIFVLFSHSLSEVTIKEQKKMLTKLGGHVAASAVKATHFVADSFARSRNMLEIMAAGKVVVTTMWLEGCNQAEYFVDENSYILQDVQKEKQWGFCMHSSLAASRRKPLFKGMKVVVSPTTAPDFEAIKTIIECAGGQALQKVSTSSQSKVDETSSVSFVVGSEDDYDFCVKFLKKGCKVYSTELILHGVVTQSLDLSRNRLFEDYIP